MPTGDPCCHLLDPKTQLLLSTCFCSLTCVPHIPLNSALQPISSLRQRAQQAYHPLMETERIPLATTTGWKKGSGGPDHPDQFEVKSHLRPAQMNHGVTTECPRSPLPHYNIKVSPREEHEPHLITYSVCIGMFSLAPAQPYARPYIR